ncbi:CLUMA_CG001992, isoform A [Clunio marinus]|uniref:CLUMA_CG001992, isoform A n=1 Tax=Clunio marinus TaxID=568069 RepID=A0A1J1HJW5_9DIPT|nr:CLUMA_CG001992, isoform A [Clunio marinus]
MNFGIVVLFSVISLVAGIEITCKFLFYTGSLDYGYNCRIDSPALIILNPNIKIDSISGNHISFNTNSDVDRLLFVHMPNMHYIPIGYSKFFKNLNNFWIAACPIESIKKSDFEEPDTLKILGIRSTRIEIIDADVFSNMKILEQLHLHSNQIKTIDENALANLKELKVLNLSGNKIAYLPAQLFKHNEIIERIDFSSNKLRIIESSVFLNLLKVKEIKLSGNMCNNKIFPVDYALIENFISEIGVNCENIFRNVIDDLNDTKQDLETKIDKLKNENVLNNATLKNKQNEIMIRDQNNNDLKKNLSSLSMKMTEISLQKLKLQDEIEVLKMNHSDVAAKFEKLFNATIDITMSYTQSQENLKNCFKKNENLSGKIIDMKKKLDWFELNYTMVSDEISVLLENKRKTEANLTTLLQQKLMIQFDLTNLEANHSATISEKIKVQKENDRLLLLSQNYAEEEKLNDERNFRIIIFSVVILALLATAFIIYRIKRYRKFYEYRTNEFEISGNILDDIEGRDLDIQH